MPRKPTVAVDLDGVLFDFARPFVQWHDRRYGTHLHLQDLGPDTPLCTLWNGTESEAVERVRAFYHEIDLLRLEPIAGAQEAALDLRSRYDLAIVSGRDPALHALTTAWLARYFPNTFTDVVLGTSGRLGLPGASSKAQMCATMGATAIIDDHPFDTEECARAGMRALLFGVYPWNHTATVPPTVRRVADWPSASRVLRDAAL